MEILEKINLLAGEAILLDPGDLQCCAKMLTILDAIAHPDLDQEIERLRGYIERFILTELEGTPPSVEEMMQSIQELQNRARKFDPESTGELFPREHAIPRNTEASAPISAEAPQAAAVEPHACPGAGSVPSSVADEDISLVVDFISEGREHLDSIDQKMVEWEKNPGDKDVINTIFRPFHTIKGVAGFLNLTTIQHLSHQLENLLDEARGGKIDLTPELSNLIFDGVDILKSLFNAHETSIQTGQPATYEMDVDAYLRHLSLFLAAGRNGAPAGEAACSAHAAEAHTAVRDDLAGTPGPESVPETPKPSVRPLIEEGKPTPPDVRNSIRKQAEITRQANEKHIRVDTLKMDQLLNMVGELVISQAMVTHNPEVEKITDQRFLKDIAQLSRVTSTLQNISMSMRLVPIGMTFEKMSRIVRDLAQKSGKKINLVLEGQAAEIDRNMVEELYEPLVHMVRNSCDHGISAPEDRIAKGKPAEGTVTLKAEHVGGKIVISISDDGQGLDPDVIRSKAVEKGLLAPDEQPSQKAIFNLIFLPGFSTAKQVTDVSGRGVGMDVVRRTIEKLRGTVEINSQPGKGSTFTINLPLTTAIIDGMLVKIGGERYIIPTLSVRRLVHTERSDFTSVLEQGMLVKIRGELLPLVNLQDALGIAGEQKDPWNAVLVVLEDGERQVVVPVDEVIGKQEVVIKSLSSGAEQHEGVSGGAILGDGRVGLILDVKYLISDTELTGVEA